MMFRGFCLALSLLAAGCVTTLSSKPAGETPTGIPYNVPKGFVPIQIFADDNGVGVTIDEAVFEIDDKVSPLIAKLDLNGFNNEDVKIAIDSDTGFLTQISSESDAKLLEIVKEAAKAAAQLGLQNKIVGGGGRTVYFSGSFDPLSESSVTKINCAISAAAKKAGVSFNNALSDANAVRLSTPNVPKPETSGSKTKAASGENEDENSCKKTDPDAAVTTTHCDAGVCVRALTSVPISLSVGEQIIGTKIVRVPGRKLIAVKTPSTALADQDLTIGIEDGMLKQYDIKRDSELLGLVKIPGQIIGGLVAGVTQQLTDEKSIVDKQKALADSQKALADSQKALIEAQKAAQDAQGAQGAQPGGENVSIDLQNDTVKVKKNAGPSTFYLYIKGQQPAGPKRPNGGGEEGNLLKKPNKT